MKDPYFSILLFITPLLYGLPFLLIHEMGHIIACVLVGGQFEGFGFKEFESVGLGICSNCDFDYKDISKIVIKALAGSLTTITFTTIIAQLKKSFFTSYFQLISIFIEGSSWIVGGWLPASDVINFCKILNLDAKIFGLHLIPLLLGISYLLIRRMLRQLDKCIWKEG